jgi:hypothetical protein
MLVLIGGCASNNTATPILVLPWPMPMTGCVVSSIEIDPNTARVSMSYQDNISIAVCERDMFRYIKDLTQIICVHQPSDKSCKEIK